MANKNGLKLISALVPLEWIGEKEQTGLSWRQLIARGIRHVTEKESFENELNYFLGRAEELNKDNQRMKKIINDLNQRLVGVENEK